MKQLSCKTILLFAVGAILTASCSKTDDRLPQVSPGLMPATSKVKTQKSGSSETVYEYDAAGRVKKMITNGTCEYVCNYSSDSLVQTRYLANGTVMETCHIKLNSNGLVENYLNDSYPSVFIKYEFNTDKTTARKLNYDNGNLSNITWYFYNNGNLVKDSTVNQGGNSGWYGRIYEYYTDKYSTLENPNKGQAFWGAGNKNALKKVTYLTNGMTNATQDYQVPEVDAQNRISKIAIITNNAGTPAVYTYTYY